MRPRGSPREGVRGLAWIVQVLSTSTRPKLSPFPSTLTNFRGPGHALGRWTTAHPLASRPTRGAEPPRVSTVATVRTDRRASRGGESSMLGLLAHGFHLLLLVLGLAGVLYLLFPQVQAATRSSRRTTYRAPASPSEHEQRVAELRASVLGGQLTTA